MRKSANVREVEGEIEHERSRERDWERTDQSKTKGTGERKMVACCLCTRRQEMDEVVNIGIL